MMTTNFLGLVYYSYILNDQNKHLLKFLTNQMAITVKSNSKVHKMRTKIGVPNMLFAPKVLLYFFSERHLVFFVTLDGPTVHG